MYRNSLIHAEHNSLSESTRITDRFMDRHPDFQENLGLLRNIRNYDD